MTPSLQLVSEQFPLLRDRVACLFERDEIFRELCDDYRACAQALSGRHTEELSREYMALQLRLETELLGYLGQAEEPSDHHPK